ncbi:MAG TPA: hypothetical protein VGX76_03305 [Pirellulales bacterium]|jgi:hypothetical protein|nr:hypothetical protein [Pirellulales bacterium]HEV3021461.1 hypothetical protein [Pirellulales bacterium]
MFKRLLMVAVLMFSVLTASSFPSSVAEAKSKSTSSRMKTQRFKGYKTKAGTNVKSYTRAKAKRR